MIMVHLNMRTTYTDQVLRINIRVPDNAQVIDIIDIYKQTVLTNRSNGISAGFTPQQQLDVQDLNNISASLKPALPQRDTQFLLDLFRRATLSKTEARRLAAMLASIGGMINRGKWS